MSYIKFGSGSKPLLAFHGFGQNATRLKPLFESHSLHTVYAFDLFLHGESRMPDADKGTRPLKPEELRDIFEAFFKRENIEEFDAFGFSLGAKTVLQLLWFFPEKARNIHLAAPDGFKLNPWYFFVVHTRTGSGIFKFLLANPSLFNFLLGIINKLYIPNKKTSKFVVQSLNTQPKRNFVYNVWTAYKALSVDTGLLAGMVLTKNHIKIHQYYGEYDTIISQKPGRKFAEQINQSTRVHVVHSGHNLLFGSGLKALSEELKKHLN